MKYVDYEYLKLLAQNNDDTVVFKWNEAYRQVFDELNKIIYQK